MQASTYSGSIRSRPVCCTSINQKDTTIPSVLTRYLQHTLDYLFSISVPLVSPIPLLPIDEVATSIHPQIFFLISIATLERSVNVPVICL